MTLKPGKYKASMRFITVILYASIAAFIIVEMLKYVAK